jgi:DNA-3-methyladenine glycosylase II
MENSTTRIIENEADIAEGVAALIKLEPKFRIAVENSPPIPLRRKPSGFAPLLQAIVGQQISVAAAAGIWARIEAANAVTAQAVLNMSDDELRACGLSRPKVKYAKAIAEALENRTLCFDFCRDAPVEDALAMLTAIKGVGPWTAEIYLMFSVGRADVFAPKDLALQEAAKLLFGLDARPSDKELAEMAKPWSPWRAIAARILWAYYGALKGREGIVT